MKLTKEEFEKMLLEGLCLIPLGKGYYTEVSEEDFEYLLQYEWKLSKKGYAYRYYCYSKIFYMSIEIAKRMGLNLTFEVDHKNRDTLNNQRNNLREATRSQQKMNARINKNNITHFPGINFDKITQKFRARVQFNGKCVYSEYFDDLVEAHEAREKVALELFDEYHPNYVHYHSKYGEYNCNLEY